MRIALDARPLCEEKPSGIPTFLRRLLEALGRRDRANEYLLYAHKDFDWSPPDGMKTRKRVGSGVPGTLWMQALVPQWLAQDRPDLFWGTQHTLPLAASRRLPMALTVLDLIYERLPQAMTRQQLWLNRLLIPPSVRRADRIGVISRHTGRDLRELLEVQQEKIHLTYCGVEPDFRPMEKPEARRRLGTLLSDGKPFLLAVGALEPKKNMVSSLRAFRRLMHRWPHDLVVAGPPGWNVDDFLKESAAPGLRERVRTIGYVDRGLLPALYAAADAFLFPSLYEGFGLPPLEAMACGTPVAASDAGSLPEVLGEAALFCAPLDDAALAANIGTILSDPARREEMSRRGKEQAALFTWDATAREMMGLFNRAAAAV